MNEPTASHRRNDANFRAALDVFNRYDSFWITSHIHPDPDAVGCQLALFAVLNRRGKRVEIVNEDPPPRVTHHLPYIAAIRSTPTIENADVLVVLDVADRDRIGDTLKDHLVPNALTLNIDHHVTGKPFADVACIITDACATSEILYDLFAFAGDEITPDIAECLYTGIIGDTGNFRFSNTSPHALEVGADLVRRGVRPNLAYERVYGSLPENRLRLLSRVLGTLERTENGRVAWLRVTQTMFRETGTDLEDVDGFSDYARSVDGVEAVALFGELPSGRIKVSLRARGTVKVNGVAASFGGGGHEYAAGCVLDPPMADAERRVIATLVAEVRRSGG